MAYEKHTWVNNETITAAKMNNIEDGIEEAAQSDGSAYDIIFQVKSDPNTWLPLNSITVSDIEIVSGSIEALEQKLLDSERVSGLFEVFTSYGNNGYDMYYCWQMAYFDPAYRDIWFGAAGNGAPNGTKVKINYASDYTLNSVELT